MHSDRPRRASSARDHEVRAGLLRRARGRLCPLCRTAMLPGERLHLDHILPRADGGDDDASNLRVSHGSCNELRGAAPADCLTPSPRGEEGGLEAERRRAALRALAVDELSRRRHARADVHGATMRRITEDEAAEMRLWDQHLGGEVIDIGRDEVGWWVTLAW